MILKNKTILITGSATGIGEAMARLFHAQGANVVIHGKEISDVRRVSNDLGDRVLERTDDLSDSQSPQNLIAATVDASLTSPLGDLPLRTRSKLAGDNRIKPVATASRATTFFEPMSIIPLIESFICNRLLLGRHTLLIRGTEGIN